MGHWRSACSHCLQHCRLVNLIRGHTFITIYSVQTLRQNIWQVFVSQDKMSRLPWSSWINTLNQAKLRVHTFCFNWQDLKLLLSFRSWNVTNSITFHWNKQAAFTCPCINHVSQTYLNCSFSHSGCPCTPQRRYASAGGLLHILGTSVLNRWPFSVYRSLMFHRLFTRACRGTFWTNKRQWSRKKKRTVI